MRASRRGKSSVAGNDEAQLMRKSYRHYKAYMMTSQDSREETQPSVIEIDGSKNGEEDSLLDGYIHYGLR